MLEDVTSSAVRIALKGLAQRQRVIADNIANIETPGFLAGRVQFEEALRTAVTSGSPDKAASAVRGVQPGVARSLEPTRENGNNVNLDHETLSHMDTVLRYQTMLKALDAKYGQLRSVIRGGA
ncbi:flagellar basal body rod protein FlgB [Planobispora rosea]|uniref:Flagellar basal body rod protein FlgB n=1 Tax=Planobispora rosea TaxID=35762 RepID=A0A8J3S911_PLARO|nr:flagellar basal body rod protein FlgB [Planobispora rosea]GGS86524.1 flagellar basal body rod protein FlgB [Planobispora rosea]GIH88287.1 flagellar basal body rod protein FlgB [Planobispora rosea]